MISALRIYLMDRNY